MRLRWIFGQVAVEISSQDFCRRVSPNVPAVLQLGGADLGVMEVEPAAGFLAPWSTLDVDEISLRKLGVGSRFGIGAVRSPQGPNWIAALRPLWKLLDTASTPTSLEGAVVEQTRVVVWPIPQRVAVGINASQLPSASCCRGFLGASGGAILLGSANWRNGGAGGGCARHRIVNGGLIGISRQHCLPTV